MKWQPKQTAMRALLRGIRQESAFVYVVGGAVRDFLLARTVDKTDLDLVIATPALAIANRVADRLGWAFYPLDSERDVARLVFNAGSGDPLVCDIAGLRGDSIEADLLARDFTVNALAFALDSDNEVTLIDFCGGLADLQKRSLRTVTPASLAQDPVRVLRAVRFVRQLDFTLEEETLIQVKRMSGAVRLASPERVRDEMWKTLMTAAPAQAVDDLRTLGLLPHLLPELGLTFGVTQSAPHVYDVYTHTCKTIEQMALLRKWINRSTTPADGSLPDWLSALEPWHARLRQLYAEELAGGRLRLDWLVWHALLHDWGKPSTRTVEEVAPTTPSHRMTKEPNVERRVRFLGHELVSAALTGKRLTHLRFSRHEVQLAEAVAANHMRLHQLHTAFPGQPISRRACFRYFRDIGGRLPTFHAGVDTLLLAMADVLATYGTQPPDWADYLAHVVQLLAYAFAEDGLQQMQQKPLLDGHMLMQHLKLQPGRQVGDLLQYVLEAQAAGEAQTLEEALEIATQWLREHTN